MFGGVVLTLDLHVHPKLGRSVYHDLVYCAQTGICDCHVRLREGKSAVLFRRKLGVSSVVWFNVPLGWEIWSWLVNGQPLGWSQDKWVHLPSGRWSKGLSEELWLPRPFMLCFEPLRELFFELAKVNVYFLNVSPKSDIYQIIIVPVLIWSYMYILYSRYFGTVPRKLSEGAGESESAFWRGLTHAINYLPKQSVLKTDSVMLAACLLYV